MTVALMWEARAVPGRGPDLLAWAEERARVLPRRPVRREVFRAPQDRVLVITWWNAPSTPTSPSSPSRRARWSRGRCTGGGSSRWGVCDPTRLTPQYRDRLNGVLLRSGSAYGAGGGQVP